MSERAIDTLVVGKAADNLAVDKIAAALVAMRRGFRMKDKNENYLRVAFRKQDKNSFHKPPVFYLL